MATREDLVKVWMLQHDAQITVLDPKSVRRRTGRDEMRDRLKRLVAVGAVWLQDVDEFVALEGQTQIRWKAEPSASQGDGTKAFTKLLDGVGPLALAIVGAAFTISRDPRLRAELVEAGLPEGSQVKGSADDWVGLSGRGSYLLTVLTDFSIEVIGSTKVLVDDHLASWYSDIVDSVAQQARAALVNAALGREEVRRSIGEIELQDILMQAELMCLAQCPQERTRVAVSEAELLEGLDHLTARWARRKPPWRDTVDSQMSMRLAHTLIDPKFFLPHRQGIVDEFHEIGWARIQGQARSKGVVDEIFLDRVAYGSEEKAWGKLVNAFVDFYVNPAQEPPEFAEGGWRAFLQARIEYGAPLEQGLPDDTSQAISSAVEGATLAPAVSVSEDRESPEIHALDSWLERDAWILQDPRFQDLVAVQEIARVRQPTLAVERYVLIAGLLCQDSSTFLGDLAPAATPWQGGLESQARAWVTAYLADELLAAWRSVGQEARETRARSTLALAATFLEEFTVAAPPTESTDPGAWVQVRSTVSLAVRRAAAVQFLEFGGER